MSQAQFQQIDVRDFPGIGSLSLIEDILCSDFDLIIRQMLLGQEEVNSRWSNNDFDSRVKF